VRKILIAVMSYSLMTCATFSSIGWVDLPDGHRLKAVKVEVTDPFLGTDVTHTMVYNCPPKGALAGSVCVKDAEFGGASASLLKTIMHGAGAGAAIGAGIAVQDADRTNVSNSAGASSKGSKAVSKSRATSSSRSRSNVNVQQQRQRKRY